MSRKAKFTPEEKEQAVIDYLEGNKSRTQICGELCISSRTIQDWALIYNKHGLAGFSKKMRNGSYSKEFKMKVVEEYVRGDGSSIDLGIKPVLVLLNTPASLLEDSINYMSISLGGLVIAILYYIPFSVLRSLGDSKTPIFFCSLQYIEYCVRLSICLDIPYGS